MNRKTVLTFVVLLALLGAAILTYVGRPKHANIRVQLSGTAGLRAYGEYTEDGVTHPIEKMLPAEILSKAKHFEFTVSLKEPGTLRAEFRADSDAHSSATATGPSQVLHGTYENRWFARSIRCETIERALK